MALEEITIVSLDSGGLFYRLDCPLVHKVTEVQITGTTELDQLAFPGTPGNQAILAIACNTCGEGVT
jgi:hypothetical protein